MYTFRRLARISSRVSAGLAILAMAACRGDSPVEPAVRSSPSAQALAPTASPRSNVVASPYRGVLMITESVPDPSPPPGCQQFLHTAMSGQSTHLGEYTGTGTTCGFNGQLGVVDPPVNPGGGPPPFFVSEFTIEQTHTAANGDLLYVSGHGFLVQSVVDGSGGIAGTGMIEGGTGRFAGATGSFQIQGPSDGPKHYEGWISLGAPAPLDQ